MYYYSLCYQKSGGIVLHHKSGGRVVIHVASSQVRF